jgi:hypothetical protein
MRKAASLVTLAVAFSATVAAHAAEKRAAHERVVIGEVSSQVARAGTDYEPLLRSASEDELRMLDLSHVPKTKRVVVSVALVSMDTLAESHDTDATCVVNAVLREARGGTIFAILEGKARAKSGGAPQVVERSALEGAIHGALARIPEVLRR